MTPKVLPRFDRSARRPDVDRLVRPLPGGLAELAGGSAEAQRHTKLAYRYGEARTKIVSLGAALAKAREEDDAAERGAAEAGRRAPRPKAPKLEEELGAARRELEVLEGLIEESAAALLAASLASLPAAREQAREAQEAALEEAASLLLAAGASFDRADAAAAESAWLALLAERGHLAPYAGPRHGAAAGAA